MNRNWCLVPLLLLVCLGHSADAKSSTRQRKRDRNSRGTPLIGGKFVTDADEAGWQVALIYNRTLICAGTLLRDDVVLTAAECVKDMEPADMIVRGGSRNFKSGGQARKVRETIYHPDFVAETPHAYNVALMQLVRPFNATMKTASRHPMHIRNVELPADDAAALPSAISLYGWGYSKNKVQQSMTKKLRVLKSSVYSSRKCAKFLAEGDRVESAFCVGDSAKRADVCNDDLGSPAMLKGNIQFGIVAVSSGCSEDSYTTVLTNVLAYKPWIMETLGEFEATTSKPI